jgi:hypothetical protein
LWPTVTAKKHKRNRIVALETDTLERIRGFVHDEDDDEHNDRRADDNPEMLECFVFIFTDIKKICKKKQHIIKEIAPNRSALNF